MTNDRKRSDRGIDLAIDIEATLEEVWQALTTGEGIARWFAPHAAVTPGEGGSVSGGLHPPLRLPHRNRLRPHLLRVPADR